MDNATIKAAICAANDNLLRVKQAFYRHEATYDDMTEAARRVLELRIAAETQYMGKARTKMTTRAISSLIR
jgi:hypothetical protein